MSDIETLHLKIVELENYFKGKIKVLEDEIDQLKMHKHTPTRKKKTIATICKELNESYKRSHYDIWINKINITRDDINDLLEKSMDDYIKHVLNKHVRSMEEEMPVVVYEKKLFICNGKWELLKNEHVDKMLRYLQTNTMKQLALWESTLDYSNDKNINKMIAANQKLLCIDFTKLIKMIKQYLPNHLEIIN
tara:strand:- start:4353 stop:4928 length:576 start_codon:yes stop_codon:yes gene_type:complete